MNTTNKGDTTVASLTRGWGQGLEVLPIELRGAAQGVLDAEGPTRAAAILNVSVGALTRGCAGAPVRRGTIALLTLALQKTL